MSVKYSGCSANSDSGTAWVVNGSPPQLNGRFASWENVSADSGNERRLWRDALPIHHWNVRFACQANISSSGIGSTALLQHDMRRNLIHGSRKSKTSSGTLTVSAFGMTVPSGPAW